MSWEEHIVRLLAASGFKAGLPSQLLKKLALPLYQVAEEFAQSPWDVTVLNVFQKDQKIDTLVGRPPIGIHLVECCLVINLLS